jgi:hypothetical protein
MTTLREAAQQALEACTDAVMGWQSLAPLSVRSAAMESLDALRDALAQQEDIAQNLQSRLDAAKLLEERRQEITQSRREWRNLTMQEINALPEIGGVMWRMGTAPAALRAIRAIEAALKEKNHE